MFLATAHSIKWKEYENVIIENDFKDIFLQMKENLVKKQKLSEKEVYNLFYNKPEHPLIKKYVEEVNLAYVAITRAIKDLTIKSTAINNLLELSKKDFIKHLKSL